MDYIKINNKSIPYPNDFTMTTEPIIANEITTMRGKIIADIVGSRYADTTLSWDYLNEADLKTLLEDTNPSSTFTLGFVDADTQQETSVTALRVGRVVTKTRFRQPSGKVVWTGIAITLRFPDPIE